MNKPIKLIIKYSKETVDFADFINEVLDFEEEGDSPVNKPPPKNKADFIGDN